MNSLHVPNSWSSPSDDSSSKGESRSEARTDSRSDPKSDLRDAKMAAESAKLSALVRDAEERMKQLDIMKDQLSAKEIQMREMYESMFQERSARQEESEDDSARKEVEEPRVVVLNTATPRSTRRVRAPPLTLN
jgi:hypothetical protein